MAALVGPGTAEIERLNDLIASVESWEPRTAHWVLVDDGSPADRQLERSLRISPRSEVVTLPYPRERRNGHRIAALGAGTLLAMSHVQAHTHARFMLKVDTDALAIGPFADAIERRIDSAPSAGVLGTLGDTCNPELRDPRKLQKQPRLMQLLELVPPPPPGDGLEAKVEIPGVGAATVAALRAFASVRPHIERAVNAGYRTLQYCQGGAYAVTRSFMDRMRAAGYFDTLQAWNFIPSGEDVIVGMYARAVGLEVIDCCRPGEPFGINCIGLAYEPERLISLGYSLIHSLKRDHRYSESELRAYFAGRRGPGASARQGRL